MNDKLSLYRAQSAYRVGFHEVTGWSYRASKRPQLCLLENKLVVEKTLHRFAAMIYVSPSYGYLHIWEGDEFQFVFHPDLQGHTFTVTYFDQAWYLASPSYEHRAILLSAIDIKVWESNSRLAGNYYQREVYQ